MNNNGDLEKICWGSFEVFRCCLWELDGGHGVSFFRAIFLYFFFLSLLEVFLTLVLFLTAM